MFQELLEKIARALDASAVAYMVIGGQAVLLYGEPRLTRDIDITLGIGAERLPDILRVGERIGLTARVGDPSDFVGKTMVLPCEHKDSGIRVDFIFSWSPYEQQALRRTRSVQMGRAAVQFASVEDVIIHKIIAGRPRDLEDVKTVLLKNPHVDNAYIHRWLHDFQDATTEPYLERFEAVRRHVQ